jgi:Protein of unknown function (DUF2917)
MHALDSCKKEFLMDADLLCAGQKLAKGGLFLIHDGRGRRVECLAGCLWLTQERDRRDIVLEAGEGFTVERAGDTILNALSDSCFVVLDAGRADAVARSAAAQPESAY